MAERAEDRSRGPCSHYLNSFWRMTLAETVWPRVTPFPSTPPTSLDGGQPLTQTEPGTEDRDSKDQCAHSTLTPTVSPLPNSKCLHPLPLLSCTLLPSSHDELVPGRIKSKLREIPDTGVAEVGDPWLQVWWRERKALLLLVGACFQLHQRQTRGAR